VVWNTLGGASHIVNLRQVLGWRFGADASIRFPANEGHVRYVVHQRRFVVAFQIRSRKNMMDLEAVRLPAVRQ